MKNKKRKGYISLELVIVGSVIAIFSLSIWTLLRANIGEYSNSAVNEVATTESYVGQQVLAFHPSTNNSVDLEQWVDGDVLGNAGLTGTAVEISEIIVNGGTEFSLYTGEVIPVSLSFTPANATVQDIAWRIREGGDNIAVVRDRDSHGLSAQITGVKAGTAIIEVKAYDTSAQLQYIYINVYQHAQSIVLSRNGTVIDDGANIGTFSVGDRFKVNATVFPDDTTNIKVIWSKGNAGIGSECIRMTPDDNENTIEIIRSCNNREVTIIATTDDEGYSQSFKFTVR